MCDSFSVPLRSALAVQGTTVCASALDVYGYSVQCFNSASSVTFVATTSVPAQAVELGQQGPIWNLGNGTVYNAQGPLFDSVQASWIGASNLSFFALDAATGTVSQTTQFVPLDLSLLPLGSQMWAGTQRVCVVSATAIACSPSFTSFTIEHFNNYQPTPVQDMSVQTVSVLWTDPTNNLLAFGIPPCPDAAPTCTAVPYDGWIIPSISAGPGVTRVSAVSNLACAVHDTGTVTCWGDSASLFPWAGWTDVVDIGVYSFGACVQTGAGTLFCSGSWNLEERILGPDLAPGTCIACDSMTEFQSGGTCWPCGPGKIVTTSNFQASCTACSQTTFRAAGMSSCEPCGPGSQTIASQTACAACLPSSFWNSLTGFCVECPAGQGGSADRLSCTACPAGTARAAGEPACHACNPISLPNTSQTLCQSCTSPYRLLFAPTATVFTQGTCTLCPNGTAPVPWSSSCSLCEFATVRTLTQASCTACPAGQTADASHTLCIPCPSGQIRASAMTECAPCPWGQQPNASQTVCVESKLGAAVAALRVVGYGVSATLMCFVLMFRNDLPQPVAAVLFTMAALGFVASALVPAEK